MLPTLRPDLSAGLYLRDPQDTALGRRLLVASVQMLDELGFEAFTFKKVATVLHSTEASLYRYFENKHQLLTYLVSWHWAWLRLQLRFATTNLPEPRQQLRAALAVICYAHHDDPATPDFDEAALYRVVVAEASKSYLTRNVDADSRAGMFREYERLAADIVPLVTTLNPTYPYPNALVSTLLEAAHKQLFFAQHLPALTDGGAVIDFLEHLALTALKG